MKNLLFCFVCLIGAFINVPTSQGCNGCLVLDISEITVNDTFLDKVKQVVIPYVRYWKKSPDTYFFVVKVFEEKESENEVYIAALSSQYLHNRYIINDGICAFSIIDGYKFFFYRNAELLFMVDKTKESTFRFQTTDEDYVIDEPEWLFKVDSLGLKNYLVPPMPYAQ